MNVRLLILVLSLSCGVQSLFATHIIGGEMTYECLGGGDYEFTLTIYRDCSVTVDFDSAAVISIFECGRQGDCSSLEQGDQRYVFEVTSPVISRIPSNEVQCLEVENEPCAEKGVYTFRLSDYNISLPNIEETYHVVYQRCCRNAGILNLVEPEEEGVTFSAEIPPMAQEVCNNSPVFASFPPIIICQNFELDYLHSAIDQDGDSLVYRFSNPISGGGRIEDINRDIFTGEIQPNSPIFKCDGAAPKPGCPPPFREVSYLEPTYDVNAPLGLFTSNDGVDNPVTIDIKTGQLSGVPPLIGLFVMTVVVEEYRNQQLLGSIRREFQYTIVPCANFIDAIIANDSILCEENVVEFEHATFPPSYVEEIIWEFDLGTEQITSFEDMPTITFPGPGSYTAKLLVNPDNQNCKDSALLNLSIFPPTNADFTFSFDSCSSAPIVFENLSTTEAQQIVRSEWQFDDEGTSLDVSPAQQFTEPGEKEITLTITDNNNCKVDITKTLGYFPLEAERIPPINGEVACTPLVISYDNLEGNVTDDYEIEWDFGDGNTSDAIIPMHTYEESGTFLVKLNLESPNGCISNFIATSANEVAQSPIANFSYTPEEVSVTNPVVTFTNESINGSGWSWDFNGAGNSLVENPVFKFPDTGQQVIELIAFHENECTDTFIQIIDIVPSVELFMPNAFTPNGDGKNDFFIPVGFLLGPLNYRFSIWNRWGEQVFFTTNINDGWNGRRKNNGNLSPNGIYTYLIEFNDTRGNPHLLKGYATLIR